MHFTIKTKVFVPLNVTKRKFSNENRYNFLDIFFSNLHAVWLAEAFSYSSFLEGTKTVSSLFSKHLWQKRASHVNFIYWQSCSFVCLNGWCVPVFQFVGRLFFGDLFEAHAELSYSGGGFTEKHLGVFKDILIPIQQKEDHFATLLRILDITYAELCRMSGMDPINDACILVDTVVSLPNDLKGLNWVLGGTQEEEVRGSEAILGEMSKKAYLQHLLLTGNQIGFEEVSRLANDLVNENTPQALVWNYAHKTIPEWIRPSSICKRNDFYLPSSPERCEFLNVALENYNKTLKGLSIPNKLHLDETILSKIGEFLPELIVTEESTANTYNWGRTGDCILQEWAIYAHISDLKDLKGKDAFLTDRSPIRFEEMYEAIVTFHKIQQQGFAIGPSVFWEGTRSEEETPNFRDFSEQTNRRHVILLKRLSQNQEWLAGIIESFSFLKNIQQDHSNKNSLLSADEFCAAREYTLDKLQPNLLLQPSGELLTTIDPLEQEEFLTEHYLGQLIRDSRLRITN